MPVVCNKGQTEVKCHSHLSNNEIHSHKSNTKKNVLIALVELAN